VVSDFEANSSHTIFAKDIVSHVQLQKPEAQLYWILGEDQWEALPFWKNIDDYAHRLIWVVCGREFGHKAAKEGLFSRSLKNSTCPYRWAKTERMPEVSSSRIRDVLKQKISGDPAESWLPEVVKNEIANYYAKETVD
jgi:nicotinic acid mononucleotide adenylyltransferase